MTVQIDLSQYDAIERARYYLQVGQLWEHVRLHLGEHIQNRVLSFLFREDFLSAGQRKFPSLGEFPLLPGKALNAARLDNDDVVSFPPFPAPEIPANMKVSLTVIE
jgi:hypothetical protein